MDPTANAREQWEIVRAAEQARAYEPRIPDTLRDRLRELRAALADWRGRGGFAPEIKPPTAEQCERAFGETSEPTREESFIRSAAMATVADLVRNRLRGAVVLGLVFEPADADACTRGYVAWERSIPADLDGGMRPDCGTHAFTIQLRADREPLTLVVDHRADAGHTLHGGSYDMGSAREALADLADRSAPRP